MSQNSTPFRVAEYDEQIKKTLPFYEEMYQQIVDIVKVLNLQSFRWLDVGCGTGKIAGIALDNFDIRKVCKLICYSSEDKGQRHKADCKHYVREIKCAV